MVDFAKLSRKHEAVAAYHALSRMLNDCINDPETFAYIKHECAQMQEELLAEYGVPNPKHPECRQCVMQSVFGGPDHDASPRCQSGRRPHCSCSTCF